jgi:hypothetical protein
MKITIVLDTDKETVEDLKRLQKGIDELIGKKLGVTSEEQPQVEPEQPKPQLQTIEPERDPQPSSTGFPTQPEAQQFSASSPHEIMEKVQEQSNGVQNQQAPQQQPRGWPSQPEQPKEEPKPKKTEGEKSLELEDINDAMSKLYSGR